MKYFGVEIPEKKICWLFWYVKIATMFMAAERRNAERQTRR